MRDKRTPKDVCGEAKVVSDYPRFVDFTIGLVNSVLNLPHGQVKFFGEFILQKNGNQSWPLKIYWGGTQKYPQDSTC